MLTLSSGANSIILTLNDSITLSNPEYVIVFEEGHRGKKVACKLGTDLSDYPERFNKFTITLNADPDPLSAEVTLKDLSYRYYVYEMADADSFDFEGIDDTDLDTIDGMVENGKAKYVTAETSHNSYKDRRESVESYGD